MEKEEIAKRVSEYLRSEGISQVKAAERLKVSKAFINALCSGRQFFGKKTAEKWEKEFGISKIWLLTGEGEMIVGDINQSNVSGNNIVGSAKFNELSDAIMTLIQNQTEQINRKDEQIDRLLSIIEKQNEK